MMKYYNKSIKRLSLFGNLGAISIAVLGLLSYMPGLGLLGSIRDDYIPMAPSTAISFIALGCCLYAMSVSAMSNLKSNIILSVTILISLFGLLTLIGSYYGVDLNFENTIVPDEGKLNNIPIGRMSPSAGAAFFLAGTAILLLILQHRLSKYKNIFKHTGGAFGVIIIFTGFTFCLSYFYGTPLLYNQGTIIPMALTTSLAFLLLGFGIIGLAGESAFPNYYLIGPAISNYLFRYILPLCVLSVVMGGGIVIYASHIVQINPALAAASLTAIMIFVATICAILISKHIGNAINKAAELVLANKELAFQNEEKEKRAAELVLANKELTFQNEEKEKRAAELQQVNEELKSFSYSVSHDLRAPLRALDGFSQVLMEDYKDKLDENGQDSLQRIRNASVKMGELIDSLLKLSRISQVKMKAEKTDLSEIAGNITRKFIQDSPERDATFVIQPDMIVDGDASLLEIVLNNLLGNAWKFTRKKKKTQIEFSFKKDEKSQETVYSIRDNGAGFNMAYADKLFGAFQRLHTQDEFEGSGIGLATVNRIIQRHHGKIWAESVEDKGTVFYFTLNM